MSLRRTTLAFFIFTTLGLLVVSLVSLNRILKPHFVDQQKAEVSVNLQRTEKALQQHIDKLAALTGEWVNLPGLQAIPQNDNTQLGGLISPEVAAELDLIFLLIIDSQGNLIIDQEFEGGQSSNQILPNSFSQLITTGRSFTATSVDSPVQTGLVELNNVPIILVYRPIESHANQGKLLGTLIAGSLFDQGAKDLLSDIMKLDVSLIPTDQITNQAELGVAIHEIKANNEPYILISDNLVSGYAIIPDLFNNPAFLLKIEQYPSIYRNGELIFNYIIFALIMSGLTFITILFLLIEGNVLTPLRRISEEVTSVGRSGDINRRLMVKRKDELGSLGSAINNMLADLQQANVKRQESEERFQKLVESMDDLVFTIDRETNKIQVYGKNAPGTVQQQGNAQTEQLSMLIHELSNQIEVHKEVLEKSYAGDNSGLEWAVGNNEREHNYYTTLSPMVNSLGEITSIVGVSRDITDIKNLEKDLRQRANEFSALYETSQLLLSQMDIESTQDSICHLAVDKIGLDSAWLGRLNNEGTHLEPVASHVVGFKDLSILPLDIKTTADCHLAVRAYLENEIQVENLMRLKQSDSDSDMIQASMISIPLNQGSRILAILTLIKFQVNYFTADNLKLAKAFANLSGLALQNTFLFKQVLNGRERLQSVSRRLVEVQEEERRKIALELHDEIGQILTGLRLSVDMINKLPPNQIAAQTQKIIEIITELISKVRQMSLDLRPSMLDDLGIVPTILWHIDRYTDQTGIQVAFHQTNMQNRRFRTEIETTTYRVVQEALTNIARYAKVKAATVRLWCTDKILGVQIEDEGQGFNPDEAFSAHRSRGLLGMRERIGFLGGQLSIVSQLGQGTSLTIEIPLEGRLERRTNVR